MQSAVLLPKDVSLRRQNQLTDAHMDKIVALYEALETDSKICHLASIEEIRKNNFNCSIQRYVRSSVEEEIVDFASLQQQEMALIEEITELNQTIHASLEELGCDTEGTEQ